ncbi:hypothetical protein DFR78_13019 [Halanaerobium sp. MA284_MarDTE_T2]|nr:hypothetical protein DFR78_13019 [Halanaerobium sp. MA284_MarDTE_T2]
MNVITAEAEEAGVVAVIIRINVQNRTGNLVEIIGM